MACRKGSNWMIMFQSSVNPIRRLQTRRRVEVCGLILPLKEEVTTALCHEFRSHKKNSPEGVGFRPEVSFR
jgi:hypothetical protein